MKNVCAVNTLKDRSIAHGIWCITNDPQPHEPEEGETYRAEWNRSVGTVDVYRCRHCGSLYREARSK